MPESVPLLGSLHRFTVAAASDGSLVITGPLFTADKINKNGWGVPAAEAPAFAETFAGKPIRWCPKGVAIKDPNTGIPIPAEHYCDAINSNRAIVGNILEVYPDGTDNEGRTVYYQKAKVTDPKTAQGIMAGTIPTNVSMWAYAKTIDPDGMGHGWESGSESIVSDPAYSEAQFQWRKMAAAAMPDLFRRIMAAQSYPYVPTNPENKSISAKPWNKKSLGDYTDKSWDDLSDAEQNKIRSGYAAVTGPTFSDCRLGHHEVDGTVNASGVRNALARFSQTQGLGKAEDAALAHLKSHLSDIQAKAKGASMAEKSTEEQTTLPGVNVPATPGQTININLGASKVGKGAADGKGKDDGKAVETNAVCAKCGAELPAHAQFCPACGAALHASCSKCGSTIPVGAKFCPSCGTDASTGAGETAGDNSVAAAASALKPDDITKIVEQRLAAARDEDNRRTLAASVVATQIRIGTLADADKDKRTTELIAMPAATLTQMFKDYCTIAEKLGKPVEQGMHTGQIPAPAASSNTGVFGSFSGIPMPAGWRNILKSFTGLDGMTPMTEADIAKFGLLKMPTGVMRGTYHQEA